MDGRRFRHFAQLGWELSWDIGTDLKSQKIEADEFNNMEFTLMEKKRGNLKSEIAQLSQPLFVNSSNTILSNTEEIRHHTWRCYDVDDVSSREIMAARCTESGMRLQWLVTTIFFLCTLKRTWRKWRAGGSLSNRANTSWLLSSLFTPSFNGHPESRARIELTDFEIRVQLQCASCFDVIPRICEGKVSRVNVRQLFYYFYGEGSRQCVKSSVQSW